MTDYAEGKILARSEGGVGTITFNQPEKRNAMSIGMWDGIVAGVTAAWDTVRPAVPAATAGATKRLTSDEMRGAQKKRFGGMQLLPGLFGWLAALSVSGVLLLASGLFELPMLRPFEAVAVLAKR